MSTRWFSDSTEAGRRPRPRARVAVAVVALLALAACGSDGGSSGTGGPSTNSQTTQGGGGGAPSGDPIKVGVLVTLSGPAGSLGQDQQLGLEIARDELNARGGILGRPIELVVVDDAADATTAAQGMRKLIDQDDVDLIFGPTISSPTLAAVAISAPAKKIEFMTAAAPELGDASQYPHLFRMTGVSSLQATSALTALQERGFTKIATLGLNDASSNAYLDAYREQAGDFGIEIVSNQSMNSGSVDVTTQLSDILSSDAEAIVAFTQPTPDQIAIIKSRNQLGSDIPIFGVESFSNPLVTEGVGQAGMTNVYAVQQYKRFTRPLAPEVEAFLDTVRSRLKVDVLERHVIQVASGYDALMMMAAAAEAVGSLDSDEMRVQLEAEPHAGIKASYVYTAERHDGEDLDDFVLVEADSFDDGAYTEAPLG